MSYRDRIVTEIHSELDRLAGAGDPWNATWVAHTICSHHKDGLAACEDAEFWRYAGYRDIRDSVRRVINRRAGDKTPAADDKEQADLFPGYVHLQRFYLVTRSGEELGVPVEQMTDAELEAKAAAHRSMGSACFDHADEIERFIAQRSTPMLFDQSA